MNDTCVPANDRIPRILLPFISRAARQSSRINAPGNAPFRKGSSTLSGLGTRFLHRINYNFWKWCTLSNACRLNEFFLSLKLDQTELKLGKLVTKEDNFDRWARYSFRIVRNFPIQNSLYSSRYRLPRYRSCKREDDYFLARSLVPRSKRIEPANRRRSTI